MLPQNDIHPENNQYLVESNLLHPEKWQGLCLFGGGYMVLWEYDHYYQRERERNFRNIFAMVKTCDRLSGHPLPSGKLT